MPSISYANRQKSAVIWSGIERFSQQGVSLLVSIVIARLLVPADYGVIAMIYIFISISQSLIDCGFSSALIQKTDRTETDYSTVFYFNIVFSLILYFVLFFTAPAIAQFYDTPQLVPITRLYGIVIVIQSLNIIQQTKLIIELRFRTKAKITFCSVLISGGIGIILAWHEFGPYALAWQLITATTLTTIGLWICKPWKPQLTFSRTSFKQLFSFGSKLAIGGILTSSYNNLLSLIMGKVFSQTILGLYTKADAWTKQVSMHINISFANVAYPVLCECQHDAQQLKATFFKYLRINSFLIFPLTTILCAVAKPLTLSLLGEKWILLVPFLQLQSIQRLFVPIIDYNWKLFSVKGRSDLALKSEIFRKIIALCIFFAAVPFGIRTVLWGLVLFSVLDCIILIAWVRRLVDFGFREEWRQLRLLFLATTVAGIAAFVITFLPINSWLQLFAGAGGGIIVYLVACRILNIPELQYLKRGHRNQLHSKKVIQ